MYTEFSLIDINEICLQKSISVLNKLPGVNGPQLVTSLIKPLVNLINDKSESNNCFQDDKDVLWIMEVIGYGLSLPLSDNEQYEAVRDCVKIYCEWLHALSANLSQDKFIPKPIKQNPNLYCQKIIGHLYNTFLPRIFTNPESSNDFISKQALICHRILRLLIPIATEPDNVINSKTWECLLIFLLGINDKLLKSPANANDIGTQLADRVISTLFQGWLISCVYFFPSPSFWKTFQHVCINFRHRPALISQWNRVNICLTKRLVSLLYRQEVPMTIDNKITNNFAQYNSIVVLLKEDVLKQCWYRFLHIIGNPIDLCFPNLIYSSDISNKVLHEIFLNILPFIFHKAIKGICTLVDIFLGVPNINLSNIEYELPSFNVNNNINSTTPVERWKISVLKNNERLMKNTNGQHIPKEMSEHHILPNIVLPVIPGNYFQNHIKLTSILDIFGKWLFQASFISVSNVPKDILENSLINDDSLIFYENMETKNTFNDSINLSLDLFEAGQAEALGTLCRIFCLKKDDEDISLILTKQNHPDFMKLKNYITSFYLALKFNLIINEQCKTQILSSILVNSVYFFEIDLPGSKILVPHFFHCIDSFLSKKEKNDSTTFILVRRACIKILISLLSYPLHYKNLPIKDNLTEMSCNTFVSYYPRLILLLIYGLYNEPDQNNIQMILNTFLFIIEDCVHHNNISLNQEILAESMTPQPSINLMEFFNNNYFQMYKELQTEKLNINLFLLITSFISDILCKSSLKNSNYNISLTALEILLSLGRIKSKDKLLCNNKCSLCIRQICQFIENQCYKPPMYHSKDMHSTIVAAYQCLSIWIYEHEHLVEDKQCISLLFELIELGISGSKSKKGDGGFRCEKEIHPASLRVKEAAELLLTTMMSKLELSSVNLNDNIIPCDLNETKIIELIFNSKSIEYPFNQFRYFVVENSLLISILDKQISHNETICIVRSAYGKHCFIFKNQPLPTRHTLNFVTDVSIYRTLNKPENIMKNITYNYFPDYYDKLSNTKYDNDNMIPSVQKYIYDNEDIRNDYEIMLNYLESVEHNLNIEKAKLMVNMGKKDFNEPVPSKIFEAYRLILGQFEIFNFNFNKFNDESPGLLTLNNNTQTFHEHLDKLDLISNKMNDLVMIFYVPKDFSNEEIIFKANQEQYQSNFSFKNFLLLLGNPINCENKHCSNLFYWSDILHELIFILPTKSTNGNFDDLTSLNTYINESNENIRNKLLNKCLNESERSHNRIKEFLFNNVGCDVKIFVIWLEKIDDFDRLPFKNVCHNEPDSSESEKYFIILINPLKNGLYRVTNYFSSSKFNFLTVDRMLLGNQLLASYVRLIALNLFRRRRMNIESYQLPHVKRRVKIQEIANKFKQSISNKKLASDIFKSKFL